MNSREKKITIVAALALAFVLAIGVTPALAIHSCSPAHCSGDMTKMCTVDSDCATGQTCVGVKGALEIDDPSGNVIRDSSTCEDWDIVFGGGNTTTGFVCTDGTKVGGAATDVSCVSERTTPNASIFTGGGSKDGLDIPEWAGKDGSVPDKDNIVTAFAARYTVGTNKLLYFGGDRFANNGDAQIGFWFFQNPVAFDPSTGLFSGTHKNGDLLILSNFTVGGTLTNIQAFEVANYNSTTGSFTFTSIASASAGTTHTCNNLDTICASTNAAGTTTRSLDPNYADKSGTTTGFYGAVEFFEGGLDLTKFNLGGECFASFLMETRSSQSITATLKDFVIQNFQACTASVTTEVHDPSHNVIGTGTNGVSAGTAVHDKATVIGQTGVTAPSGTVTFSFWDNGTCDGTPLLPQSCEQNVALVTVTPATTPPSAAVDNSTCTRTPGVGLHSYQATYSGDSLFPTATSDCEPFEILSVASHVTTQIVLAGTSTVVTDMLIDLGTNMTVALQDKATVTCDFGSPTGKVTFTRYSDGACTGTATVDTCGLTGHCSGTTTPCSVSATCGSGQSCVDAGCQVNSSGIALSGSFSLGANALSYKADYNGDTTCRASTGNQCEPVCAIRFLKHCSVHTTTVCLSAADCPTGESCVQ